MSIYLRVTAFLILADPQPINPALGIEHFDHWVQLYVAVSADENQPLPNRKAIANYW